MSSITVQALDARVRLEAPDEICSWFGELWGDVLAADDTTQLPPITWEGEREEWTLDLAGNGRIAQVETAGALAETMVEINRLGAESVADTMAVLHAGTFVVDGAAVAVSGTSGAGKSTTVAAAVRAGHGFLSDEVCAIDPESLMVRSYHRPIGLRAAGSAAIGVPIPQPIDDYAFVYPWRVGTAGRLSDAAPLALVAFVNRRPGSVEVEELSPADALARLAGNTLAAVGRQRAMFRRFEHVARTVRVVELRYADVHAAVDALAGFVR